MVKDKKAKTTENLLETIIHGIHEVKGEKVKILDLRSITHSIADYYVICQGNSYTQVGSISDSIEKETYLQLNDEPSHKEGKTNGLWIVLDFLNVLVHIFHKDEREKYNLEDLWGDAQIKEVIDHRA